VLWLTISKSTDPGLGLAPFPPALVRALDLHRQLQAVLVPIQPADCAQARADVAETLERLQRLAEVLEGLARLKRRSAADAP
jgi:hypothetical protein